MYLSSLWRRLSWVGAVLALGLLGAFHRPADEEAFKRIVRSLNTYYATLLPEKAYLHLDKPAYASGETIWFKAYVVEADTHRPDTLSKVLYVELVSGQQRIVSRRLLRLRGGLAHGDIDLADTLASGQYLLRAYTNWMRNAGPEFCYSRRLKVLSSGGSAATAPASKPAALAYDVQFFPEGGNLVEELESEVGFKAIDAYGQGVPVQGTVLDDKGQSVVSFSSRHLGMGSFKLTPAAGQHYRARLQLPGGAAKEVALPASQPSGYTLRVADAADDHFLVTIRQRPGAGAPATGTVLIVAQVRGKVAYAGKGVVTAGKPFVAQVPKAKFPAGLAHFTLFDEQGVPYCERLAYVPQPAGLRIAVAPDKSSYGLREPVRLRLSTTDAAGQSVAAQVSVAIADAAQLALASHAPTITSYLLLTSDLAGYVEDPGYYFQDQTPEVKQALQDLLLTQGWRRFVWKELLAGQVPIVSFRPEREFLVSGQALLANQTPAPGHQVSLLQLRPERQAQATTDNQGNFTFRGLNGEDTTHLMLKVQPNKGEKTLSIKLASPLPTAGILLAPLANSSSAAVFAERSRQQQTAEAQLTRDMASIALRNVTVRGKRTTESEAATGIDRTTRVYTTANVTVLELGNTARTAYGTQTALQYLQGRVPGLRVSLPSGIDAPPEVNIRSISSIGKAQAEGGAGLVEPLFMIDGTIVPVTVFATVNVSDLESIDILKQGGAGLFGNQGAGGVIVAHTRRSPPAYNQTVASLGGKGVLSVQIPGYYRAREFYAPQYATPAETRLPDPRYSTLYWNPTVQTDASGQAQLQFYTSEAIGTFEAAAEGITTAGQPGRGTSRFSVQGR